MDNMLSNMPIEHFYWNGRKMEPSGFQYSSFEDLDECFIRGRTFDEKY